MIRRPPRYTRTDTLFPSRRSSDLARDLGDADAHAIGTRDDEMLTLIFLARLVEIGVDEFSGDIDELAQNARDGGAVDVDVEDAHEDRHAQHRRGAEPVGARDFGRRRHFGDLGDQPVGGRDDQVAARRGDAHRVAEERSEEHTSELQSLIRSSYAVLCLKKKKPNESEETTRDNK